MQQNTVINIVGVPLKISRQQSLHHQELLSKEWSKLRMSNASFEIQIGILLKKLWDISVIDDIRDALRSLKILMAMKLGGNFPMTRDPLSYMLGCGENRKFLFFSEHTLFKV